MKSTHLKKTLLAATIFLVFFVFLSYLNYETKPLLIADQSCLCDSAQDHLSYPLKYSYGKFKGLCVNNCTRRSSFLLQDESAKNEITVANILHQDEFWRATIPLDSILKTKIIFENFTLKLNHVSIQFVLKNKIKLQSQNLNKPLKTVYLDESSIVFSPEAAPPNDSSYSVFDGFMGRYGIVFRGYSFEYYRSMTSKLNHKTKFKTLKLNGFEKQKLFLYSFFKFHEQPIPNYQLLFNNCATISMDLVLESKNLLRSKGWDIWDVLDPLRGLPLTTPLGTLRSLYWWQLVEKEFAVESDINS